MIEVDRLRQVEAIVFEADAYTLFLDGRNNAVLARDDAFGTGENTPLVLSAADLLANDREFDGDTVTVTGVSGTSAKGAVVTLVNGQVTYDQGTLFDALGAGETGMDTFTYTVDDGKGGVARATVTVTISGTDDAPVLSVPGMLTIDENTTFVTTALATDLDSASLTFSLQGGADEGAFALASDGTLSLVAAPDFEAPGDADGDNIYVVNVGVSDGTTTTVQEMKVTIADVAEIPSITARINEVHYDNAGADVGEFIEVRTNAGADASLLTLELINGNGGGVYDTLTLAEGTKTSLDGFDYYVFDLPPNGLQNGPDGIVLANDGVLVEFLSYEGTFAATSGVAIGQTSQDIGVAESGSAAVGESLQRLDGDLWDAPRAETKGTANTAPVPETLISTIQGAGSESPLLGSVVTVSAVVTGTVSNGFFLQEEAADSDGNDATSEGIFVFANSAPTVVAGDQVTLTGTVAEFFDETQLSNVSILSQATGGVLPTPTLIALSPLGTNFEAVEGMLVEVTSGVAGVNLEVIENFNLDRFGEISISAGRQTQPTQIFDPQTQAAEVAQLAQENLNNRLGIDDGLGTSNPDSFAYLPSIVGDDGDGILDADDTFTADGQTVRLGAELTNTPIGVMRFSFGEYKIVAQNVLQFDESTNNDARPDLPPAVAGSLKVGAFNVLNYFTTLDTGPNQGSVGPNNLDPRGAKTADQLARQTDKLVDAILATGTSALALQELENNGFGTDSAIGALVDALNVELVMRGDAPSFAFVDPVGTPDGFIGTDAITTGIIYDTAKLTLTKSDVLVFAEASAVDTFAIADVLNPFASSDDQVGNFQRSRPAVAATFEEVASGETFSMVSVHFKSKGDSNLEDVIADAERALDQGSVPAGQVAAVEQAILDLRADPNFNQGDGQAVWNQARADAAAELATWLDTVYAPGDPDVLILGDYNAYSQEDPVTTLRDDEGYRDLLGEFIGLEDAYSFVFDGQQGALDQAMATESLFPQVAGVAEWHINADEPDLLNYTDGDFFSDDVFASSDHDPLIIGLDLGTSIV